MIKAIIVDDEHWNRDIIKTLGDWEQYGIQLAGEADNGEEAVRLIHECSPHIVITDMRMPGMDGIELLNYLQDEHPAIKVIVISGYDDFVYTRQAIKCKVNEYLLKPIDPVELNTALSKCRDELESVQEFSPTLNIEAFQIIKTYKPLLSAHYNELNEEGIRSAFKELLKQASDIDLESGGWRRVLQEFAMLLEELEFRNSLEPDKASPAIDWSRFASSSEAIRFLTEKYVSSTRKLVTHRKFSNRLNLNEIKQFIDHNFTEPITQEKIAGVFFVSKEYLSKVFKQQFGQNMTDYIQGLRMEQARKWLLNDDIPIKNIAEMCGYEEVAYFYRVFKKHFGIAPGELRKNNLQV
ncbi:response regulator [Paenibacillus abyssi]|uniref:DNA-binding response regulator n=1 Tax=Paenibacillus abyssi TaxID=1340531 RepID=A0A917LEP6_9BACL|nr:response regulator [Paenibacillus abyssi]GGG16654.1 hypothetical protein GCM10010916_36870 [Paenibacillus abyssi]